MSNSRHHFAVTARSPLRSGGAFFARAIVEVLVRHSRRAFRVIY